MKIIDKVSHSFWPDIAENCPYATVFHTPYWSDVMSKTFDYTDITKGFIFDDGTKVVLPFMRRKRLIFDEYISGPPFVYGGPISISEIKEGHIQELAEYIKTIAEPYKTIIIRGNPYQKTFVFDGFSKVNDHSHILDLTGFASEADYMQKKIIIIKNI